MFQFTFTFNNDDCNELFVIQGINIVDLGIQIYSRWGQKVFESNTIKNLGMVIMKRIAEGSYYYHIVLEMMRFLKKLEKLM